MDVDDDDDDNGKIYFSVDLLLALSESIQKEKELNIKHIKVN
jgi:hypothetical protein